MPIKRNEKLVSNAELQAFFDDFESRSTVLDGGGLSFSDFRAISYRHEILPDAFIIKPALRRSAAIRLFQKALHQARANGPLTAKAVIENAENIHRTDRSVPLKSFTLWTKIRARKMDIGPGVRFKWADVSIRTAASLPNWLRLSKFHNSTVGEVDPTRPAEAGYVILSCEDRREDDAVDRMLDALQLVMALLNLYETRGRWTLMSGNGWTAGNLRMGPFQFVFQDREFLGENRIWYEPNYHDESWNIQIPVFESYRKFFSFVRDALASLASHPLKAVLVAALQLMQDGFEARDGNHRLLRFWAALEKLYVEDWARERSNQKVIDRATFADDDYRLTRWHLGHIARVRNEHVHARGHEDALMDLGQTLRELLTKHVLHWIFHGRDFADHQALLTYVDLPRDDEDLKTLRRAIDRRMKLNKLQREA